MEDSDCSDDSSGYGLSIIVVFVVMVLAAAVAGGVVAGYIDTEVISEGSTTGATGDGQRITLTYEGSVVEVEIESFDDDQTFVVIQNGREVAEVVGDGTTSIPVSHKDRVLVRPDEHSERPDADATVGVYIGEKPTVREYVEFVSELLTLN